MSKLDGGEVIVTGTRRNWIKAAAAIVAAVLATTMLTAIPTGSASAAETTRASRDLASLSGSQFRAGNIISDLLFYDSKAMTAVEIQTFLDAKVGRCTNALCLNVIRVSASSYPADVSARTGATVCTPVTGGAMSVANWIYRVQLACGISAKVILVTLQKEQGLVTKTAPADYALRYAMGMGCPDTTGCTNAPQGLATQIYLGTKQLKTYKAGKFARQPGLHNIQYHPNTACGSTSVRVENYATAALYNYTPYQPNAAALANLYGTGNSCSSYGNRNFWRFYSEWFGSTQGTAFGWIDSGPGIYAVDAAGDLVLYAGNGKGGWKTPTTLGNGWQTMSQVVGAGDVDGDAHRDIVALDPAGALWIYPSDGLAGFGNRYQVAGDWAGITALFATGDFTGDRKADLLSRDAAGVLRVHPGDGLGGFTPAVQVGTGYNGIDRFVGVGDWTGDGRADFLGRDVQGKLWVYKGNGTGALTTRTQIGSGWGGFDSIMGSGDFNGDKRGDVLARNAAGQLVLYRGNGTGGWSTSAGVVVGQGWGGFSLLTGLGSLPGLKYSPQPGAGDLNADLRRDVLARDTAGTLWSYPGGGTRVFPRIQVSTDWAGMKATTGLGDIDRDGASDVLAVDASGVVRIYPGNKAGGLGTPRQIATGWSDVVQVSAAGDLTGDRIQDVLVVDTTGRLWLHPGNGSGGLAARSQVGNGWTDLRLVTPGDFDGDRIGDIMAITSTGIMRLYRGIGDGSWAPPLQIGTGWHTLSAVYGPGDFNGQGTNDVFARDAAGVLWLYPGNGVGGFGARIKVSTGWQTLNWIG